MSRKECATHWLFCERANQGLICGFIASHDFLNFVQTVPMVAISKVSKMDVPIGNGCRTRGILPKASKWTGTKKNRKNNANVFQSLTVTLITFEEVSGAWESDDVKDAEGRKSAPHFSQKMRSIPVEAPHCEQTAVAVLMIQQAIIHAPEFR